MKIIIDRIEGDYAIVELEDGITIEVPKLLFGDAKEGDVFSIRRDEEATDERFNEIDSLFERLKGKRW